MKSYNRNEQRVFRRNEEEPEMVSVRSIVNKHDSETQMRMHAELIKRMEEKIKSLPPGWDAGMYYESEEEYEKGLEEALSEIGIEFE